MNETRTKAETDTAKAIRELAEIIIASETERTKANR